MTGVARMPPHESTWKLQLLMDEQHDTKTVVLQDGNLEEAQKCMRDVLVSHCFIKQDKQQDPITEAGMFVLR
jgi:hypothetical protein